MAKSSDCARVEEAESSDSSEISCYPELTSSLLSNIPGVPAVPYTQYLLFVAPSGYSLFRVRNIRGGWFRRAHFDEKSRIYEDLYRTVRKFAADGTNHKFTKSVDLVDFSPFDSTEESLIQCKDLSKGRMTKELRFFLGTNLERVDGEFSLGVEDLNLGSRITEELGITCKSNTIILELLRGIRSHFHELIGKDKLNDLHHFQLKLARGYSKDNVCMLEAPAEDMGTEKNNKRKRESTDSVYALAAGEFMGTETEKMKKNRESQENVIPKKKKMKKKKKLTEEEQKIKINKKLTKEEEEENARWNREFKEKSDRMTTRMNKVIGYKNVESTKKTATNKWLGGIFEKKKLKRNVTPMEDGVTLSVAKSTTGDVPGEHMGPEKKKKETHMSQENDVEEDKSVAKATTGNVPEVDMGTEERLKKKSKNVEEDKSVAKATTGDVPEEDMGTEKRLEKKRKSKEENDTDMDSIDPSIKKRSKKRKLNIGH